MIHGVVIPGEKVLAWPNPRPDARPKTFPTMALAEALTTTFDHDAFFQPVVLAPAKKAQHRIAQAVVSTDEKAYLTALFIDFDLPAHREWATEEEEIAETKALVQAATEAGLPRPHAYSTKGGARLVWELAQPVEGRFANSYFNQFWEKFSPLVKSAQLAMDANAQGWTRGYRLPRTRRDGVMLVPAYLTTKGEALTWQPERLEEGVGGTSAPVLAGDSPDPEPLLEVEWCHIPVAWHKRLRSGEPPFRHGGRNDGFFGKGGIVGKLVRAVAEYADPDPEIVFRALAPVAKSCWLPGDEEPTLKRLWEVVSAYCASDAEDNEFARDVGLLEPDIQTPEIKALAVRVKDGYVDDKEAAKQLATKVKTKAAEVERKAYEAKVEATVALAKEKADNPWLVHAGDGKQVYVWDPDDQAYIPVPKDIIATTLERLHGAEFRTQKKGLLRFTEVYDQVGVLALERKVWHWMPGLVDRYDKERRILHQTTRGPGQIKAEYHEDVAEWLDLLCVDEDTHGRLLDWLSCCTDLTQPIAALFLMGAKGTGKSLLGLCVASFWGPPQKYEQNVLTDFTEGLARSPVLLADDGIRIANDKHASAFKSLITEGTRPVNTKNVSLFQVEGYPRVVVSGNGIDAIELPPTGTAEHQAAIAERVLFVEVSDRAIEFFKRNGRPPNWVTYSDSGAPGKVAEHILWLKDNHVRVTKPGRLLVEGDPESSWQTRQAAVSLGVDGSVLAAIANWAHARKQGCLGLFVSEEFPGLVLVNAKELHASWVELSGDDRKPPSRRVAMAVAQLSPWSDSKLLANPTTPSKGRARYYAIPVSMVVEAAAHNGIGDPEAIEKTLHTYEEERKIRGAIPFPS